MVAIPTVKTFCGCCDLKIPCIVMAILRLIVYIISVLAYLYFFVVLEIIFREKQNRYFRDGQVDVLIRVLVFVVSVNIFVTILFIIGVKSVRFENPILLRLDCWLSCDNIINNFFKPLFSQKNHAKMEYYVIAVGLNALLFVFLFKIFLLAFAAIECYILLCSYSLYMEYKNSCQVTQSVIYNTVNTEIKDENYPNGAEPSEKHYNQCLARV